MGALTSRERFARMYEHRDADRVPIIDSPWGATIERWHREGMPEAMSFVDYFDIDRIESIHVDNSPRFPTKTIEDTPEYRIYTTPWGATLKNWKHAASTPEFIDFTITDPASWKAAKERMRPDRSRIDWKRLEQNYPRWRSEGAWITAGLWFGFDVTHSWHVGTERILIALIEDPEWCTDMFSSELVEIGMDALNPLEVKAGMNPVDLKKTYGDKLVFQGGINAVLWNQPDKIRAEMTEVVPVMKQNGGYIFSSDHSVPSTVSLVSFRDIVEHAKTLGSYA